MDAQTIAALLFAGFAALTLLRMMAAFREAIAMHHEAELKRAERRRIREAEMMAVATGA